MPQLYRPKLYSFGMDTVVCPPVLSWLVTPTSSYHIYRKPYTCTSRNALIAIVWGHSPCIWIICGSFPLGNPGFLPQETPRLGPSELVQ